MVNLKSKSVGSFSKIHINELKYSLSWKDNKRIQQNENVPDYL